LVTATIGNIDTHANHLPAHFDRLHEFSKALDAFVRDLCLAADPEAPGLKLADTTTVVVLSEFVRTPRFNAQKGTDHWPSASAILMGRGVRDNFVAGGTGDDAHALGWDGEGTVAPVADNAFKPEHLIASLLRARGLGVEADLISTVHRKELFV
jgi:uncharacterized protein (DUF1501 family)